MVKEITTATEYLLMQSLIEVESKRVKELKKSIETSEHQIATMHQTCNRLKDRICSLCHGHGFILFTHSIGESNSVECGMCKGTGLKP